MLSQSAFNAFLKTLEEPPRHAIFILATTEKHKIIPTILSRCQIFDFRRITVKDAAEYLEYIATQQGIETDQEALHMIAQKADGAMRDALSIFDRVVSFAGKSLTRKAVAENLNVLDVDVYFESTDHILRGDIPALLVYFNDILSQGFEGHHYINGLASHFRDLMVCTSQETVALLETSDTVRDRYLEQAGRCEGEFLLRALDLANQCDLDYKNSKNHRLLVELCLMKLASLNQDQKKKAGPRDDTSLIPASSFHEGNTGIPRSKEESETPPITGQSDPGTKAQEPGTQEAGTQEAQTAELEPQEPGTQEQKPQNPGTQEPKAGKTAEAIQPQGKDPGENADAGSVPETDVEPARVEEIQTGAPEEDSTGSAPSKPIQISRKKPAQKVSGLSLSSIRAKKAHKANRNQSAPDPADLPRDPFEESELQAHWAEFAKHTEEKGRKILASSLNTDVPKLIGDHTIWIELPNSTMKKEVERDQYDLMEYLRNRLNNYSIQLKITVNEETARQFAFTPEEKYQKLRDKNPAIDLLRKTFDLEL